LRSLADEQIGNSNIENYRVIGMSECQGVKEFTGRT
jgi:hypothetical protein